MATSPDPSPLSAIQWTINTSPTFPAFSANVQELLTIQDNPYNTVNAVSAIILRDLSLTTQILKVVNSVFYQTHARQVHTVSSAVMILGFDHLRDLAVGLRLFENFRKSNLSHLKQLIVLSFLTAIQAQEMARNDPSLKAEEVFITALLFNIGELIVAYYLPREYQKIIALVEEKGWDKTSAAQHVLQVSMESVGLVILKDWNFPPDMLKRLSFLHAALRTGSGPEARLWKMIKGAFVLSNNLMDPLIAPSERQRHEERVCRIMGLNHQTLTQSLTASKKRLHEMTQILRIDLHKLHLSEAIMPGDEQEARAPVSPAEIQEQSVSPETKAARAMAPADHQAADLRKLQLLYQVMEEVNQALVSQAPINQVLLMVLEGIFRGIRFDRVIFLLVNPQRTWITGRFGLGVGVEELLPVLHLPLKASSNVFALAMEENREYLVNPYQNPGDRALMDVNFWAKSRSQTFLVVPLLVDQIPIGAFFVDRLDAAQPISEEDRRRLRIFRDLSIIALRLSKKAKIYE
ncbi:MAG: HDOD domain-containing protein [Desulfobaccales bacterium]